MEANDDLHDNAQLSGLLKEWPAPDLPATVEQRVLRACRPPRRTWWRSLFVGYIRVPVYVVYLLAALLTAAGYRFVAHATPGPCVAQAHTAAAPPLPVTLPHPRCRPSAPAGFC